MGTEYTLFTLELFGTDSPLVWTQWLEFVSMNIFCVSLTSTFCVVIFISYTGFSCVVFSVHILIYRFRESYRPLSLPYNRLTTLRLLRFVHHNVATMQFIFSLNRIYGFFLLAFIVTNMPSNIMIAIDLVKNKFLTRQMIGMLAMLVGQLTCLVVVHLLAAVFSANIHRPFKRIQSLTIRIQQCPLRARIHLANAIQTFHVRNHKYGITYGAGKLIIGLVTIMSFTKFVLLYGEMLMYQYSHSERSLDF